LIVSGNLKEMEELVGASVHVWACLFVCAAYILGFRFGCLKQSQADMAACLFFLTACTLHRSQTCHLPFASTVTIHTLLESKAAKLTPGDMRLSRICNGILPCLQAQVLVIGLGGGALPMFLHNHLPLKVKVLIPTYFSMSDVLT
jgi:hypothetical protein